MCYKKIKNLPSFRFVSQNTVSPPPFVRLLFVISAGCGQVIHVNTIYLFLSPFSVTERSAGCKNCAKILVESLMKWGISLVWFRLIRFSGLSWAKTGISIHFRRVPLLAMMSNYLMQLADVCIYTLNPPNSPAVLTYWRVISYVLNQFPNWQRCIFRKCAVFDFSLFNIDMLTDSHFHLDLLFRQKN